MPQPLAYVDANGNEVTADLADENGNPVSPKSAAITTRGRHVDEHGMPLTHEQVAKKNESAWDYASAVVRGAAHGLGIPASVDEIVPAVKNAALQTMAFPYKQAYDATVAGAEGVRHLQNARRQPTTARAIQEGSRALPVVGSPIAAVAEPGITYSEGRAPTHEQNMAAVEGGTSLGVMAVAPKVISAASKRIAAIYRAKGLPVPEAPAAEAPPETPLTPEVTPEQAALVEQAGNAQAEAATKPQTPRTAIEQAHRDAMRRTNERAGMPPPDELPEDIPPDNVRPIRPAVGDAPPVPPGHVRLYHGGELYDRGSRWLTPDLADAQGWAKKTGGGATVQYVDVPEDSPSLIKAFEDEGTSMKAPYIQFEAPEEMARGLRPLSRQPAATPETAPEATGATPDVTIGAETDSAAEPKPASEATDSVATETPVQRVTRALREATPLRGQQEAIYRQERAGRIKASIAARADTGGEAGFNAELGAMRGQMERVQFESLRDSIKQPDIDSLFNQVRDSPDLSDFQKISARRGLTKLFGEYGGNVPQKGELNLLSKVFGDDFVNTANAQRPLLSRATDLGLQIANIPRSLMASFDLSAPLRQGVFFVGRVRQFFPAFVEMHKYFGSEVAHRALMESIEKRPTYDLMQRSGLSITGMTDFAAREERFGSPLVEKVPVIGAGVRASERAYTGFLNKLRADVFDDLVSRAHEQGLDPLHDTTLSTAIAKFVNAGTGRGDLPAAISGASDALNAFFFSPRLMASRLTLLNPFYYIRQPKFVRIEALKSAGAMVAVGATVAALAKMRGANVESDPRSADFGKVRFGNTRLDPWGGFQQYVRMGAQLTSGKYVSTTSGMEKNLGEGRNPTRYDILIRQLESKEAPIASFVTTLLRGKDFRGQPVDAKKEVLDRMTPMLWQDLMEIAKDDPDHLPFVVPAAYGVGVQTYDTPKR
jgi:hypothetical protein